VFVCIILTIPTASWTARIATGRRVKARCGPPSLHAEDGVCVRLPRTVLSRAIRNGFYVAVVLLVSPSFPFPHLFLPCECACLLVKSSKTNSC
jgi:hypothetical protein